MSENTKDQILWFESRPAAVDEAYYWLGKGYATEVRTTGYYTACIIRNYNV